jgi:hypothetical protein
LPRHYPQDDEEIVCIEHGIGPRSAAHREIEMLGGVAQKGGSA